MVEGEKEGGMEGEREGGMEGEREEWEGGIEGEREGGRDGGRERNGGTHCSQFFDNFNIVFTSIWREKLE